MIKAFLFDVDGVLTPSADVSAALVSRYFASKSLSIKEDEVVPFMGKGMKALLEESAKYLNTEISLDEALSFFRENYSKELKERKPKEKAREFVLSARSKGIKIGIVSIRARPSTFLVLTERTLLPEIVDTFQYLTKKYDY